MTNTGEVRADEVAQVYISPVARSSSLKPIQLQGFARVTLAPGETRRIELTMHQEQLGYYCDGHWNIDPGRYRLLIGASSRDIRLERELVLTGDSTRVLPLREYYLSQVR